MIICIDVGGTAVKYAVFDGEQAVLTGESTSKGIHSADSLVECIAAVIDGCGCAPTAIGLDIAGLCDYKSGVVKMAENLGITSPLPLGSIISERYGVPCRLHNDVNAAALGEAHYGAAKGDSDFLCLTYGTGIGGAIMLDGRLFVGQGGMAGEVGHIVTHPQGRPCPCGQSGCYEQYASTSALVRAVSSVEPTATDGRKIFAMIGSGYIRDVVDRWIDEVVIGLASLVHTLNPSSVVLGGGIMNERYIIDEIRKKLPERLIEGYRSVQVKNTLLGNKAGLYGMLYCLDSEKND